jgi:nitrogen fixation protein FixH
VSVEPYRKGLAYNERIAASDRQAEQGWSDAVSREPDGALVVSMKDTSGAPLRGLRISGVIGRGASARTDAALDFTDIGDGRYRATPPRLAPGTWVVTVEARRQGEQSEPDYRARRRLWLER